MKAGSWIHQDLSLHLGCAGTQTEGGSADPPPACPAGGELRPKWPYKDLLILIHKPPLVSRYTLVTYHFSIKHKVDMEIQKKKKKKAAEGVVTGWKKYRNHYYSHRLQLAKISSIEMALQAIQMDSCGGTI